jgi:hypothetical protein
MGSGRDCCWTGTDLKKKMENGGDWTRRMEKEVELILSGK